MFLESKTRSCTENTFRSSRSAEVSAAGWGCRDGGGRRPGVAIRGFSAVQRPAQAPRARSSRGSQSAAGSCSRFKTAWNAATREALVPVPGQITNGDETEFPKLYRQLFQRSGAQQHWRSVEQLVSKLFGCGQTAATRLCSSRFSWAALHAAGRPSAGLGVSIWKDADSHQLAIGTPPSVASRLSHDAAVESYWMAAVPRREFHAIWQRAAGPSGHRRTELRCRSFTVRKPVTPQNLFRGFTAGDVLGPYASQFQLKPFLFGALPARHSS